MEIKRDEKTYGTNMDINKFNVTKNQIAEVSTEETFYIGENKDIEVVVNLYKHKNKHYMTSWLNGCEECNTIRYEGSLTNREEIHAAMEALVDYYKDYIIDLATDEYEK